MSKNYAITSENIAIMTLTSNSIAKQISVMSTHHWRQIWSCKYHWLDLTMCGLWNLARVQFHVSARESLLGKDKKKVFIDNDNEEVKSAGKKTGKKIIICIRYLCAIISTIQLDKICFFRIRNFLNEFS